jgi:hypothetical protein
MWFVKRTDLVQVSKDSICNDGQTSYRRLVESSPSVVELLEIMHFFTSKFRCVENFILRGK